MSALTIEIEVLLSIAPGSPAWHSIVELCSIAYEEDFDPIMRESCPEGHVLGFSDGILVSHACWSPRSLQIGGSRSLRTAYVEAVATLPSHQRRGIASAVLRQLAVSVADYELAALSPSDPFLYMRLGWRLWRGPLSIRTERGLVSTPDNRVMILSLPRTPAIDLDAPMSAEWRPGELW
jgi:aminoglycoside 2'-N-acetyltransferase I